MSVYCQSEKKSKVFCLSSFRRVGIYPIFACSGEDAALLPKVRAVTPENQADPDSYGKKPDETGKKEEEETRRISQVLGSVGPSYVWEPSCKEHVYEGQRLYLILRLEDGMNRKLEALVFTTDTPEDWCSELMKHKLTAPVRFLSISDDA